MGLTTAPIACLFRDLAGATRDPPHKDTAHWPSLTRAEKLELFGWIRKKTPDNLWSS